MAYVITTSIAQVSEWEKLQTENVKNGDYGTATGGYKSDSTVHPGWNLFSRCERQTVYAVAECGNSFSVTEAWDKKAKLQFLAFE